MISAVLPAVAAAEHDGMGGGATPSPDGGGIDTVTALALGAVGLVVIIGIFVLVIIDARRNAPAGRAPHREPGEAATGPTPSSKRRKTATKTARRRTRQARKAQRKRS